MDAAIACLARRLNAYMAEGSGWSGWTLPLPPEGHETTHLLPPGPRLTPVSRTARNLSNTCPGPVCASYHVSEKYDWTFRPTSATTVIMGDILGDSNVTRISTLPRAGRPVHAHSYRGAKLCHFANQILESSTPERSPQTVILSIGINSSDINKNMAADQVRRLFYRAITKFPMPEF